MPSVVSLLNEYIILLLYIVLSTRLTIYIIIKIKYLEIDEEMAEQQIMGASIGE